MRFSIFNRRERHAHAAWRRPSRMSRIVPIDKIVSISLEEPKRYRVKLDVS